ncbi:MAG: hypothetical protein JRG74_10955 [Deltaproteobacteria bacterium]|nr:hypothetical protein [Deltaproteobacteria bacterium]
MEITENIVNSGYLVYAGKPIFPYGPSPQNILTYLPRGNGNDVSDWINWAKKFGINNVRSYPPSTKVGEPATNVFEKSTADPGKFDLNLFNDRYFEELRKACLLLKQHNIIVHLQFWQAVYWKKVWEDCYYNPKNNINPDISTHAGPGEFVTMKNPALLDHQKRYVLKILDATGDLGNVFYDIMNEIGNGTGTSEEWVREIINTIHHWETNNKIDVLLTLNDEGGMRMGDFSLECDGLDMIVKDLGRYDEHVNAKSQYHKPTISVRNIDYDYQLKKRGYFAGKYNLEVNTDGNLQTRGRKYWWRMFMAGVQIAGGYADTYSKKDTSFFFKAAHKMTKKVGISKFFPLESKASYPLNQLSEENFIHFRRFVDQICDYQYLRPSSGILVGHPARHSYCLQSEKKAIIYIESPNGRAGFNYVQTKAKLTNLMLEDGHYQGTYYFPANGRKETFLIELEAGEGELLMPSFKDDLAIIIRQD